VTSILSWVFLVLVSTMKMLSFFLFSVGLWVSISLIIWLLIISSLLIKLTVLFLLKLRIMISGFILLELIHFIVFFPVLEYRFENNRRRKFVIFYIPINVEFNLNIFFDNFECITVILKPEEKMDHIWSFSGLLILKYSQFS